MSALGDQARQLGDRIDEVLAARDAQAAADAAEILRLRHELEQRPSPEPVPEPPSTRATHVIEPRDTLWSLAGRYETTVEQLTAWNPGINPRALPVGKPIFVGPPLLVPEPGPDPQPEPEPEPVPEPTVGRFPADPGPGKVIVGMATTREDLAQLQDREARTGMGMAFRIYNNGGIGDLAVPNGPLLRDIKRDHAAGRVPVCSPKPGIEALAAHRYGLELEAFFRWTEAQDGYTVVIVHHEPENDWTADHFNLPAMAEHAADFVESQKWVRACLNKAAGGKPKKTLFIGSLLTYSWTSQGKGKFGPVDQWNPGRQPDGSHVWDLCGGDHYEPSYTAGSLDTAKWRGFVASVKSWGCIPAITENGVNNGNVHGGKVLAAFLDTIVERDGVPLYLYFDSKAGPGGALQPEPRDWWTLTEANGSLQAFTAWAKARGVNPNGRP